MQKTTAAYDRLLEPNGARMPPDDMARVLELAGARRELDLRLGVDLVEQRDGPRLLPCHHQRSKARPSQRSSSREQLASNAGVLLNR